jgi:hypothetical protein
VVRAQQQDHDGRQSRRFLKMDEKKKGSNKCGTEKTFQNI